MSAMNGAAVDFTAFLTEDQIEHEILSPDGVTGTGWVWILGGPGHEKAVAHQNEQSRKALRKSRQIEQAQVNGKKYVPEERTADEQRRDNAAWIASRAVGWSPVKLPFITGTEEPVPFSDEMVIRVLMHPQMGFVFAQLVDAVTEDKRFMRRSGTISERTPSAGSSSTAAKTAEAPTAST